MPIKIRPNRKSKATHYDNLKVSEKAPPEVIKAAYRVLSMRWHPDRNPGDPKAGKIMGILNAAYEVLSDPVKREEYDARLAASRLTSTGSTSPGHFTSNSAWSQRPSRSFSMVLRSLSWRFPGWTRACAAVLIVGFSAFLANMVLRPASPRKTEPSAVTAVAIPTPPEVPTTAQDLVVGEEPATLQQPVFDLRFTNPLNGRPWPKKASYLEGFERQAAGGYSSVTVDNSKNTSDVFLKLVSVEYGEHSKAVRVCFIPRRTSFTFARVTSGRYELRYQEVEDGACLKTESFVLSEKKHLGGVEYTALNVPLYGLAGRSLDLLRSDEHEFLTAVPTASR